MLALFLWVRGNVGIEIWRMFVSDTPKIEILHVQYNRLLINEEIFLQSGATLYLQTSKSH